MTRDELYAFVTKLLFGYAMDVDLFYTMLDVAQAEIENARPWMVLRAEDSSITVSTGSAFTTPLSIAATNSDFRKWYGNAPITLVDSQNNPIGFQEIPIAQKFTYRNSSNRFYCDYTTNKFYICGTLTQGYTVHQFYIKKATLVSSDADAQWVFPAEFHKLLALKVAIDWKGVDYDMINNQNITVLQAQYQMLYDQLTRWDSDLQAQGQTGIDPFGASSSWSANSGGGTIGM